MKHIGDSKGNQGMGQCGWDSSHKGFRLPSTYQFVGVVGRQNGRARKGGGTHVGHGCSGPTMVVGVVGRRPGRC